MENQCQDEQKKTGKNNHSIIKEIVSEYLVDDVKGSGTCNTSGIELPVDAGVDDAIASLPSSHQSHHHSVSTQEYHDDDDTLSSGIYQGDQKETVQKIEHYGALSRYEHGDKSVSSEENDDKAVELPQEMDMERKDEMNQERSHHKTMDTDKDCSQTSSETDVTDKQDLPQAESILRKDAYYKMDLERSHLHTTDTDTDKDCYQTSPETDVTDIKQDLPQEESNRRKDADYKMDQEKFHNPENNFSQTSSDIKDVAVSKSTSSSGNKEASASLSARHNLPDERSTTSNPMTSFANPYLLPPYFGQMPLPFHPVPHTSGNPHRPLLMLPPVAHPFLMLPHQMLRWPFLPVSTGPQKMAKSDFVGFSALNLDDGIRQEDERKKVKIKQTNKEDEQTRREDFVGANTQDLEEVRYKTEYRKTNRASTMLTCQKVKLPHKKSKRTVNLVDISEGKMEDNSAETVATINKETVPLKIKKKGKKKLSKKSALVSREKAHGERKLKMKFGSSKWKKTIGQKQITLHEKKLLKSRKSKIKMQLTPEKILYNKLTEVVKQIAEPNIFSPITLPPGLEIKCSTCNQVYPDRRSLWDHIQNHLRKPVPFRLSKYYRFCKVCQKYVSEIRDHIRAVHFDGGTPYDCPTCGDKFRYKGLLRNHMQNRHTTARNYMCEICGLAFKQSVTLRKHKMVHTDKKSFFCKTCDKGFKTMYALQKHVVIHAEIKPYHCDICDKEFTQQTNMKSHMRTHTGEKPYKCDLCRMAFTHNVSLKTHKKKHHGIDMWKIKDSQPGMVEQLPDDHTTIQSAISFIDQLSKQSVSSHPSMQAVNNHLSNQAISDHVGNQAISDHVGDQFKNDGIDILIQATKSSECESDNQVTNQAADLEADVIIPFN